MSAFELSDKQRREAAILIKRLATTKSNFTEAVEFYFRHARPGLQELSVTDVVEEMLRKKEAGLRSAAYLQVQRSVLRMFGQNKE